MKSWAWAAVGLLIGAGMVGAAACGGGGTGTGGGGTGGSGGSASTVNPQTTTTVGPGGTGGNAPNCGALASSLMPAACATCVEGSCCAEAKNCDMGTNCGTLLGCILQATTASAVAACETQDANGAADLKAFSDCVDGSKCVNGDTPLPASGMSAAACSGSFCFTSTIAYPNTQMDPAVDACNACLGSECCAEFTAVTNDVNNDPACATANPPCVELSDLQACTEDPTNCTGSADAKAAGSCQDMKCQATCGVPICDSGIQNSGTSAFACSSCLDTNCCMEFEASMCAPSGGDACTTWLADFNSCSMSPQPASCTGDASALAAFTCQTMNCMSECSGM
jgi:hypothetical protein